MPIVVSKAWNFYPDLAGGGFEQPPGESRMAEPQESKTERLLTLSLGDSLCAIDILCVREILDHADITRIPHTSDFMRGVVNVRGTAIPVMDLRAKFGMGRVEHTVDTRVVILEIKKGAGVSFMGVLADSVKEVLELDAQKVEPPPGMGTAVRADCIRGVGRHDGRFILILDVARVVAGEDVQESKDKSTQKGGE